MSLSLSIVEKSPSDHQFRIDLARRGCLVAEDLSKSHQSTLKVQENEITGIKKIVQENEAARSTVLHDIQRDEAKLKRLLLVCKDKELQLRNLQLTNRELEASAETILAQVSHLNNRCEVEREEHNKQTKILLECRAKIHDTKKENSVLMEQIQRVKEDITRTENMAFNEHCHLHSVDVEIERIEKDVRYSIQEVTEIKEKRESLTVTIDNLCREITSEDLKREGLRQQYRQTIGEKDIIVSCLPIHLFIYYNGCPSSYQTPFYLKQGAQLIAAQNEISKVLRNKKPLQSAISLGSHKFSCLKNELEDANKKTKHLLDEKQLVINTSDSQKERIQILERLEDDLSKQMGKNQILSAELGRPINLHRWRSLQNSHPDKWALMERVHKLQKQMIFSTGRVASQSSKLESKKKLLSKLKHEVSSHESIDNIKSQLLQMKAQHQNLATEIKKNEKVLKQRANIANTIKLDIVDFEKKRMEKTAYIVSVIN